MDVMVSVSVGPRQQARFTRDRIWAFLLIGSGDLAGICTSRLCVDLHEGEAGAGTKAGILSLCLIPVNRQSPRVPFFNHCHLVIGSCQDF
jgi:hypothetical protein